MKKLKIDDHCSIRVKGDLYCMSDLYATMNMGNPRSAPQFWAERCGFKLKRKGFFRKTYWGSAVDLKMYAEALTPGIAKLVYEALGGPVPTRFLERLGIKPEEKKPDMAFNYYTSEYQPVDPEYEKMIQRAERRAPARRTVVAPPRVRGSAAVPSRPTRGSSQGSRGVSHTRNDAMLQAVLMQEVLSEPSHSHSSSHSSHSSHSYHSHSSHDSGSYDSGSSDSGGGGSCD